jgi:hypothetical protein
VISALAVGDPVAQGCLEQGSVKLRELTVPLFCIIDVYPGWREE